MCGITGFFNPRNNLSSEAMQASIDGMTDALLHRGPDSRGTWVDAPKGIALGHRRLAIRDLSQSGHQPMISSCERYVIVYNGEIYSHLEVGHELAKAGRRLRGHSDTEVILEACAEWGVESAIKRFVGMFAFALFDRQANELYLVRDRLGIKPLYWGDINGLFFFGSELKAMRVLNSWQPQINREALASFTRHSYVPAPHSIYQGVYKLEPGYLLKITPNQEPEAKRYWDLRSIAESGIKNNYTTSQDQLINELDALCVNTVGRRMVSDVPIGTLLSGGIDSSLVTALAAEQSSQPVKTFSIGFHESEYDEAIYARAVAQHLKTDHTEFYVRPQDALDLINNLPRWYDEPFADSSQLPTQLVCQLARKQVTVVLSGDGGDELFAGYSRYALGLNLWKKANRSPRFARQMFAHTVLALPPKAWDLGTRWIPGRYRPNQFGNKLHKFARAILHDDPDAMYRRMLSHWDDPNDVVINGLETKGLLWDRSVTKSMPNFLDRMQFLDTMAYLPDDILTKVDRASMSVSLETRVPLLDHRLVEFAWKMPRDLKVRNGNAKWALRQVLYRRVPQALIDRPKMGFGVPIDHWLRGPLRDWAENLLDKKRLETQGLFNAEPIHQRWQAHLKGHENWAYPLWDILMAQAWLDENPGLSL